MAQSCIGKMMAPSTILHLPMIFSRTNILVSFFRVVNEPCKFNPPEPLPYTSQASGTLMVLDHSERVVI